MGGIHDLGGMQGFGPVERDEAVFHAPWERLAFAMAQTAHIEGNTDDFRHAIERLDPGQYLTVGYYGRWLACTEIRLRERASGFRPDLPLPVRNADSIVQHGSR